MIGAPPDLLKLRDGRVVAVRPLERRDRPLLAAAIRQLSEQSRYLRFASAKPRMTERELGHLVDVDHYAHEALHAIDPLTAQGVGVVRYAQVPGEAGVVELGATVADDWQGIGLGSALLARLMQRARDEGRSGFRASVLSTADRSRCCVVLASEVVRERALCLSTSLHCPAGRISEQFVPDRGS